MHTIHLIWDTEDGVEAGAQCYREARQVRVRRVYRAIAITLVSSI
jgi:hypothetical protein